MSNDNKQFLAVVVFILFLIVSIAGLAITSSKENSTKESEIVSNKKDDINTEIVIPDIQEVEGTTPVKVITSNKNVTSNKTVNSNKVVTSNKTVTSNTKVSNKNVSNKSNKKTIPVDYFITELDKNKIYVGGVANISVTIKPDNATNKKVTYNSTDSSVARVSKTGTIIGISPGTCYIDIDVDGGGTCRVKITVLKKPTTSTSNSNVIETIISNVNSNTNIISNKNSNVTSNTTSNKNSNTKSNTTSNKTSNTIVNATSVSISRTSISLSKGSSTRLSATVIPTNATNKTVTWSSSNTSVATVSTSGLITAKAKGSATITVTANDGSGKKATCTVTVIQPVTGISLNKTSTSINIGSTETLVATITPSNASNTGVTWSSSNTSVATVSTDGVVTPKAVGTVTITATATGNTSKKATCTVTVKRLATGISLNKSSTTLDAGTTETLVATVTPSDTSNKTVTWTSSNTSVATVSTSGVVTARSTGTATITAKTSDGTNKSATCTVTVQKAVTSIALNKTSLNLNAGNSETLTVTYTPSDATNKWVTWTSSNTNVATVNSSGRVTAVHGGTATITATTSNNISKTCTVTVYEPVSSVSVSPSTYTINVGETVSLTPTISPSTASNKNVSYSSENSSVATVNSSGVVTGAGPGVTRIKVTSSDNTSKYTYAEITVIQPVTSVSIPNWSQTIYTDQTHQYSVNVYPNNASDKSVTWTSEDESIATVDQTGLVTPKSAGVVRIWATSNSNSNRKDYAEVTILQRVTGISISNWNQTIYTNQTFDFGVNTSVYPSNASNKTIRWESKDTSVATVDENGVVTGVGPGTTRVYAYSTDGGNRSDYAQVTVLQKVTGVVISPWSNLPIAINGTYNLADNTTIYPSNASNKELTWTSNDTSVATVDSNGIVTGISEGTARITATSVDDPSISDYATVVIKPGVSSVTILEGNKVLYKGDTQQYTVSVSPDNAFNKEVTWESSNPEVASVDSNGRVTAKKSGTTTISATAQDGTGKRSEVTVTVKELITNLVPENAVYEAFVGDEISAEVEIFPYTASNCMLTWTSSDTGVVEVISTYNSLNSYSQYGNALLSANNPGTANITVKTTDGSNITKVIKVVVKKKVENISIRATKGWGYPGDTDTLEAVVTPSDATNKTVKWTSSNTSVATINSTGLLTMKGPGYTQITASATDGSGVTSTYYYYVYSRPVESLRIKDWYRELKVGETWSIKAEILPENATNKNVIWKSEDESIATVDQNGKVTAKKEGRVRIYATSEYNSNHKDFATVKVIPKAANTNITLSKTAATIGTMNVGKYKNTLQLNATVTGNSNTKVTWTSSNPKVAKVDKNTGKVTGVSDPSHLVTTVTITATTSDGKKATCKVTVEDPVSAFVRRLYKYCLNRNPDKGGFKYWVDNLKSKKMNAADVVKGFFDSKEMKDMKLSNAETIERCYLVMMDRKSDKGGKDYWIKNYAKYGKVYVLRGFVDSKEFTQICKDFNITRGTIK